MKALTLLTVVVFTLFIVPSACRQAEEPDEQTRTVLTEKGNGITKKLAGTLMAELSSEISKNGTVEAIKYCSVNALPVTDSISKAEEVKISRVSHRNRNAKNAANEQERQIIESYMKLMNSDSALAPVIVAEDHHYIYYSPITIAAPTCLKCHGKPGIDIDPEVMEVLNEKYPKDKATGFSMGELRGLFKVEFEEEPSL